ncbi:hypothetical protein EON79_06980, partial [bacterium]
ISGGSSFTLLLRPNGTVTGFGNNNLGQTNIPAGLVATQVSGGANHSVALRADGSVVAWGDNTYGQTTVSGTVSSVVQASAGSFHTLARRADGTVVAWGRNNFGQLDVPSGLVTKQVAAGDSFSMALRSDGTVAAWGWNDVGQSTIPSGLVATQIAAGGKFGVALRPNGTVTAWGANNLDQLSIPPGLTGVLDVAAGQSFTLALVAYAHCILDQTEIGADSVATGTVKLASPAPAGGQVVGLTTDDPDVQVPATVTVPAGQTSATFTLYAGYIFGAPRTVTVRTTAGSTASEQRTVPFRFKLLPYGATASLGATPLIGGSTKKGSLYVELEAPAYDAVTFQIVSSDPSLIQFPPSITINGGKQAAFASTVKTFPVSSPRTVSALIYKDGAQVTKADITLVPLRANVTLATPTLMSGESGEGGVYLNAAVASPVVVSLASGDPSVTVPASVTVAAGARVVDFPIATSPIGVNRTVPITATIKGNPFTANLRVLALPGVKSLTLPTSVFGNGKITGMLRLTISGRPGGTIVHLSSSDPSLSVPPTVTVPEGQYGATFEATATDVASAATATVTASTGTASASAGIAVNPLSVASLTAPATAAGNSTVTVTVALNTPVAVDTVVSLTSDNSTLVPVPATVTVPAGSRTATITVTLGSTIAAKNVRITATKHGSSHYRTIKVIP